MFSDRITGITGDPDKVHAMAKAFGIYWSKVDTDDGDYTMDHTASVMLLDAKGEFCRHHRLWRKPGRRDCQAEAAGGGRLTARQTTGSP